MRKTSNRDLFNISLTEILIILFFILMLFSFFQISTLTDENTSTKTTLDTTRRERNELEAEKEVLEARINKINLGISAVDIWYEIDPDDDAVFTTLVPVDQTIKVLEAVGELKDENTVLKEENEKLLETIASLEDPSTEDDPVDKPVADGGLGDCDESFLVCAPHCMPLKNPVPNSFRDYEYLLDFAFCGTDQYVVRQSAFYIANEYDDENFRDIPGTEAFVSQERFTRAGLRQHLERIYNNGRDRPVENQCKYAANFIDFTEPKRPWDIARTAGPVQEFFLQNLVLMSAPSDVREDYELRFGGNPCTTNTAILNEEESPAFVGEVSELLVENTENQQQETSPPTAVAAPIIKDEQLVSQPQPIYPRNARRLEIEGSVELSFTITKIGTVTDIQVLQSTSSIFNTAAINSVERYQYDPRTIDGEAVETPGKTVTLTFILE